LKRICCAAILNEQESSGTMDRNLDRLVRLISKETEGLSLDQLQWHPEAKWSIAQVLEHLSLTYSSTKIVFDRCLNAGKTSATQPNARQRMIAFVVTGLGYMPSGREAPVPVRPKAGAPTATPASLEDKISQMDESIAACESRFGCNVKVADHLILGPLTAPQWRNFHWVHGRHHLKQIRRLKKMMGLTGS
jgi:hypothetical protein